MGSISAGYLLAGVHVSAHVPAPVPRSGVCCGKTLSLPKRQKPVVGGWGKLMELRLRTSCDDEEMPQMQVAGKPRA